jgi:hypothetical protein
MIPTTIELITIPRRRKASIDTNTQAREGGQQQFL